MARRFVGGTHASAVSRNTTALILNLKTPDPKPPRNPEPVIPNLKALNRKNHHPTEDPRP